VAQGDGSTSSWRDDAISRGRDKPRGRPRARLPVALTIDLEEWFHGPRSIGRSVPTSPEQVVDATMPILALLRFHGVHGTFFLVGDVVARHPELIRAIARDGHELACHGLSHRAVASLGPDGLREDLYAWRALIGSITDGSKDPIGFRAPVFSIDASTPWAIPVLRDLGFRYDSSVVPVKTPLYGARGAPTEPYWPSLHNPMIPGDQRDLIEFPLATARLGPFRVPCGGGVYFRVLPLAAFRVLLSRSGSVAGFYIHPWETHGGTPSVEGLPRWHAILRHHGYGRALDRLDRLLGDRRFAWACMSDVLDHPMAGVREP
jgi:polysaccharide deacetylase family protein (PEP-CTERM system associated)